MVDARGVHVDNEKVEAILDVPTPKNPSDIHRFFKMAGWYRRFVPNFSSVVAPLSRLTHKRVVWNHECDDAFRTIKSHFISAPILFCPDFSRPFTLQTDASSYGLGAVLTQEIVGEEKVIFFLSRSLTKQEQNYSTTEGECLAVVWAVEKLRH